MPKVAAVMKKMRVIEVPVYITKMLDSERPISAANAQNTAWAVDVLIWLMRAANRNTIASGERAISHLQRAYINRLAEGGEHDAVPEPYARRRRDTPSRPCV